MVLVAGHTVSPGSRPARLRWADACLSLQETGLSDGYTLSIDVDMDAYRDMYVSLTVIAGEHFYIIYPDELEVYLIGLVY